MSQIRSGYAKCLVTHDGAGLLKLIPLNDQGNTLLLAYEAVATGFTTVNDVSNEDAGRDGYGETSGPYKTQIIDLKA